LSREGEVIPANAGLTQEEKTMKLTAAKRVIPGLAMALAGAAIALAPIAGADTNPLVPFGTNPQVKTPVGLQTSNHDEFDTSGGQVDLPF
jgi:hypothetical protein